MRLDARSWTLRSGQTVTWSACGNCVHKSPRRKRNSNACEHTKWNSMLVSPPWKPAWTHGHVNSSVLETEPHGASQTADGARALRFLLWVLRCGAHPLIL